MQKERKEQTMCLQVTEGLSVAIIPDEVHEFLMPTKEVAVGYGIAESQLRWHKSKHSDELFDGKHFITGVGKTNAFGKQTDKTFWTKRGIVRLGFFIKSEQAKLFRDWAEDLILEKVEQIQNRKELLELVDKASIIAGSQNKLAARIGITASILSHLRHRPEEVSIEKIERIETVCKHIIKHGEGLDLETVKLLLGIEDKDTRLALFERFVDIKKL